MNVSKTDLLQGDETTATVTVKHVLPGSEPSASWTLRGSRARNGNRITIAHDNNLESKTYTSTLILKRVNYKDDGNISCTLNVEGWSSPVTETRWLRVLGRPSVTISNITATAQEGEEITLTCRAAVPNTSHPNASQPVEFTWSRGSHTIPHKNTTSVYQDKGFYIYTSYIISTESALYSCKAKNQAGDSQEVQSIVTFIKKESKKCSAETAADVYWATTLMDKEARAPCPDKNYTGEVSRRCAQNEVWEDPDFSRCIPVVYEELQHEVTDMTDGRGASVERTQEVAETLTKAPIQNLNQTAALEASVNLVSQLADIHESLEEPPSREEVEDVLAVMSILVEPENEDLWKKSAEEKKPEGKKEVPAVSGFKIMDAVDKYAEALIKGDVTNETVPTFRTENIVLKVESRKVSSSEAKYPSELQNTTDEITIPAATLKQVANSLNTKDLVITVINYKSLDGILPNKTKESEYQNTSIGSRIQSISIKSLESSLKFNSPIRLFFQTNKTAMDGRKAYCTAWEGSGDGGWSSEGCTVVYSNDNGTLCNCSHMTNFAVLFAHYVPNNIHHRVLGIISIVGCTFSIIGMLLTVFTYLLLWRYLKKLYRENNVMFRAYMLINLCLVLAAANVLFMFGIEQKSRGVGCVTIAVIIHYLFLVAFTTMLVTSLKLLGKIVSIDRGLRGDTTKDLVIAMAVSWGVPLVIVVVSLGATIGSNTYLDEQLCWLSKPHTIWAFVGPVLLVTVVNTLILIRVLWVSVRSILFKKDTASNEKSIVWSALRGFAVLGSTLGIPWILGVMITNTTEVAMQYLFVIFNSTQGIFIYVTQCIVDRNVREAFKNYRQTTGRRTTSTLPKTRTFWFKSRSDKTSSSEAETTALKRTPQSSIEVPSPTWSTFSNEACQTSRSDKTFMSEGDTTTQETPLTRKPYRSSH